MVTYPLFLYFTDSFAGKVKFFLVCLFFFGTGLASDVSSNPLNDGILELNFVLCRSFVPPSNIEQMFPRVNVASQLSLTEAESAQHQRV